MTDTIIGIALKPNMIGVAGSDGMFGHYDLKSVRGGRGQLRPVTIMEVYDYLVRTIGSRYKTIVLTSVQLGVNAKGYSEADALSKLLGAAMVAAGRSKLSCIEVQPEDVARIATGLPRADGQAFQNAAISNGVQIKSQLAAEAYWMMLLGSKKG